MPGSTDGFERLLEWWTASDRVLISAGAGLSVAAGIDYTDRVSFGRLFPALTRRGFSARYELIGFDDWTEVEKWGYWAAHIHDIRFSERQAPVYRDLFEAACRKDHFVLTSNVDAMFHRHGFDTDRIYTPQGDYAALQCLVPCHRTTWPSQRIVERLVRAIDVRTQTVGDASLIPCCPECGGPVFPNVRAGHWFLEEPYAGQRARLLDWLGTCVHRRLLILEIGAGHNTPAVVRWPDEHLVADLPEARLVRINLDAPEIPRAIADRAVGIRIDAAIAMRRLREDVGQPSARDGA